MSDRNEHETGTNRLCRESAAKSRKARGANAAHRAIRAIRVNEALACAPTRRPASGRSSQIRHKAGTNRPHRRIDQDCGRAARDTRRLDRVMVSAVLLPPQALRPGPGRRRHSGHERSTNRRRQGVCAARWATAARWTLAGPGTTRRGFAMRPQATAPDCRVFTQGVDSKACRYLARYAQ
jgi:hypothetical protein